MKTQSQTISLAYRQNGAYNVYHRGNVTNGFTTWQRQSNWRVGKIVYDNIRDEFKFIPSIWFVMVMRVGECKELTDILTRLNKGERL